MNSDVVFERVAPVIRVRDLEAAVDRYRRLGFEVEAYAGPASYAFVDRGSVSLHLTQWGEYDPARGGRHGVPVRVRCGSGARRVVASRGSW